MKYTKILSLLAAASVAVSPVAMNVYAEGGNVEDTPAQTEQVPSEEESVTTTTTSATTTTPSKTTTSTTELTTTTTSEITTTSTTITAAPTTTITTVTTTSPADNTVVVKPVCEHFIKNDVNGELRISVPENVSAKVEVVYDSPEYDKHEYYNSTLTGGDVYSLAMEGRDTTEDDYRNYTVSVTFTGGSSVTSDVYSDKFNILDKNDNPDSYRIIKYNFTVDDKVSDESFTVTKNEENEKDIVVHLSSVLLGDVNGDFVIDSSDASLVLAEYALISTGGSPSFYSSKFIAADVNKDNSIDASDASKILEYYAESATGGKPSWD